MADEYVLNKDRKLELVSAAGGSCAGYELCEFYFFLNPTLRVGMRPAYGGVIENADVAYPEAWKFLQTEEGAQMTVSVADWTAAHNAVYATTTTGTQFKWNNVGGVAKYALDLTNKKLYLPDLRGMYAEPAGFDSLVVGGVHGDTSRRFSGTRYVFTNITNADTTDGVLSYTDVSNKQQISATGSYAFRSRNISIDNARVVPTGNAEKPRGFGVLPCVYLAR